MNELNMLTDGAPYLSNWTDTYSQRGQEKLLFHRNVYIDHEKKKN